jgi:hypothetical protein
MSSIRLVLLTAVLALFAVGCGEEGNVFSLEVGDCFRSIETATISDVELVDCGEPHEHEVYAVWSVGSSLPSNDAMSQGCLDRFEEAIGASYETSEIFAFPITPTEESFENGDREVICYTAEFDDANQVETVTGSALGSAR